MYYEPATKTIRTVTHFSARGRSCKLVDCRKLDVRAEVLTQTLKLMVTGGAVVTTQRRFERALPPTK